MLINYFTSVFLICQDIFFICKIIKWNKKYLFYVRKIEKMFQIYVI